MTEKAVPQDPLPLEDVKTLHDLAGVGPELRLFRLRGHFNRIPLLGVWPENRLRGALGQVLRQIACALPDEFNKGGCSTCPASKDCAYSLLFHGCYPEGIQELKRHARPPRPYVISWRSEDNLTFTIQVTVIGDHLHVLPHLLLAFIEAGGRGLGTRRDTFVIDGLEAIADPFADPVSTHEIRLHDVDSMRNLAAIDASLAQERIGGSGHVSRVQLRLTSPAVIKTKGTSNPLSPPVFCGRLLERISLLTRVYCPGRRMPPYEELRRKAATFQFSAPPLTEVRLSRYSGRQDKPLGMQAFLGQAEYYGEIAPLMPYLVIGQWLHVGKSTAFGLGRFEVVAS